MSNELKEEFFFDAQKNFKEYSRVTQELLSDRETIGALRDSIDFVAKSIITLYAKYPDTEFVFVVGGKSCRVSELLLNKVAKILPKNHPARQDIEERIHLDDRENKHLYGEKTSANENDRQSYIPKKMLTVSNVSRKMQFIICDDNMQTGRKAFYTLDKLGEANIAAWYIVFSGPQQFMSRHDNLRPDNWRTYENRIIVGTRNEKATKVLDYISILLSGYVNVRLHQNLNYKGEIIPTTIDTIGDDFTHSFITMLQLMRKMKSLL